MENTCTAIVPYVSPEEARKKLFWSKIEEEYWQALSESGVSPEVKEEIYDLVKDFQEFVWGDDILSRRTDKDNKPVSNFLPVPVEDIVYDDGKDRQRYFTIEGRKSKDFKVIKLPSFAIKASELPSMSWVMEKWGFNANIYSPYQYNKDLLRSVICLIGEKTAKHKTIFTHTGWRKIDGSWCFLHADGAVGGENIEVKLDGNLSRYALPKTDLDKDKCDDAFRTVFKISDYSIIIPFISLVFLTPLNEFLKQAGYEPTFLLNYVGRTQSRKSTLAAIMCSFFGSFTASNLTANFKDTANALEKKGYVLKDVIMVIDDFHPAATARERQNMEQTMQAAARMYGDRRARDRLSCDISLRSGNIPRGNAVVTGEDIASIGQSGIARNFIIEIKPNAIPISEELNKVQQYAADGYLAGFMKSYIEWLIPQTENLSDRLKNMFLHYREKIISEKKSGFGRTGDIVAWLMVGFEMMTEFMIHRELMKSEADKNNFCNTAWKVLTAHALLQLDKSSETTPTLMFIEAIRQLMESGKIHTEIIGVATVQSGTKVGYSDKDFYYFIPDTVYSEIVKFYSAQNVSFPLGSKLLAKQLSAEHITVTSDGKNTLQKRIGDRRGRYLCIPKSIIDNTAEVAEQEESLE